MNKNQYVNELEQRISDYLSGACTAQEKKELLHLLDSDSDAMQLFRQMSAVRAIASVPAFADGEKANLRQLKDRMDVRPGSAKQHRMISLWLKVAAIVVFILSTNFFWYHYTDNLTKTYTSQQTCYEVKVPIGSRTSIVLPDGTETTLNSGSVLRYYRAFGINERKVELQGEGYFKVAKNEKIPFFVNTNGVQVQVVGTVFNVCAYDTEDCVTVDLVEGRVNLNVNATAQVMKLFPDERAVYDRTTGRIKKMNVNASKACEWTDGSLVFDDESFEDIVRRLERKFRLNIVIKSERLRKEHFSGSFSDKRLIDDILNEIDVEGQYKWVLKGDTIFIDNK